MRKSLWIFVGAVLILGGFGGCLTLSPESSLAYWASYLLFIVSCSLNIKMFKDNPIHKELGKNGMIIATFIIVLISAYLVTTESEPEIMKLCGQSEAHQSGLKVFSVWLSSLLFTCSLFLLSFIVPNIKAKEN